MSKDEQNGGDKLSDYDRARIAQTALRRRIMTGAWAEDVRQFVGQHYSRESLEYLPPVSLERNPFKNLVLQLSTLYDAAPVIVTEPEQDLGPMVTPRLKALWPQLLAAVIAYNECFVRVGVTRKGEVSYQLVTPDEVQEVESYDDEPDMPCSLVWRRKLKGETFYEYYNIEDAERPVFQVLQDGEDVTASYYPELEAGEYPFRDSEGQPYLPFVLYHMTLNQNLFNAFDGLELVQGTLATAMRIGGLNQGLRDMATPQRYAANVDPVGAQSVGPNQVIQANPLTVLMFKSNSDAAPVISQWDSKFSAKDAEYTVARLEEALGCFAGLTSADMMLSTNASGAARIVSKEGLRRSRLQREPSQRLGDQLLLSTAAKALNAWRREPVFMESPTAYNIVYQELEPLPLTP